ncbi:MAG: DinB family protein [Planctomycetota bacterium]|nr:DinB family protein [Planctomycetota bacterium]
MIDEAKSIWAGLEFRKPMLLRNIEPMSEVQLRWIPGEGRASIAWQLWHIAEVEDNWARQHITNEPLHFPFGVQVREAGNSEYPSKEALIGYLHDVRKLSRVRLEEASPEDFLRQVIDKDYEDLNVRGVWAGVITSFAWHAGQIALTAKLLPGTPVQTMQFGYWKDKAWRRGESGLKPDADLSEFDSFPDA